MVIHGHWGAGMIIGPVAFLLPMVLLGLLVLPILWWLLRATPPSPVLLKFPGVRLLLGLVDPEKMPDRTPWWLLLLRLVAIGAAIFAFAEPILNPDTREDGNGPLLVLMDGGWASASNWVERVAEVEVLLDKAARAGRPTAFISLAAGLPQSTELPFKDARDWLPDLRALAPQAWGPDRGAFVEWLNANSEKFETYWLTDNLAHQNASLADALGSKGALRLIGTPIEPLALRPLGIKDGKLLATVVGATATTDRPVTVDVFGTTPNGARARLASNSTILTAGETLLEVEFDLPLELRNRVTRVVLAGQNSAGAVALADDGLRRRKVALVGAAMQEGPQLVAPLHFLRKALEPSVALIEGELVDVLLGSPDVIILPDIGELSFGSVQRLTEWIEEGGMLLRFAGPRLAASGAGQLDDDPLLPVRLRAGGRNLGGAMSWTTPKSLAPFDENSPFYGLSIPRDVEVTSQVVAQPGPELAGRTLASLEDGTPLVTARAQGEGRVVLFHVTANAEWSSLPLSGLFVEMLERLSVSTGGAEPAADLVGRAWVPTRVLDGFGRLEDAENVVPVTGERLMEGPVGQDAAPGIYQSGELAATINVLKADDVIKALELPTGTSVEMLGQSVEQSLKPHLLLAALGLLLVDILATLWVSGRLVNAGAVRAAAVVLGISALGVPDAQARDELALRAANDTVLAYVITGDTRLDQISNAGLSGLSQVLFNRTSIEPAAPVGVDVETDELAFFPLLYWPISERQSNLSETAIERINRYMANGGMILFDTRDAHLGSGFGTGTANGRRLRELAANLDIPPLEPIAEDHVLGRSFYLLQDFPGRYVGPDVWVEVAVGATVEGQPFSRPNDGVTPIVIGGNDWASAWAVSENGQAMFPVGRGSSGERQRELARRFGVNLVMYVMTGNYKSDQLHVPALLERLGE